MATQNIADPIDRLATTDPFVKARYGQFTYFQRIYDSTAGWCYYATDLETD